MAEESVSVRWVDHSPSNPVLVDGVPLHLQPGEVVAISADAAEALQDHPCFQVPAGDWSPPAGEQAPTGGDQTAPTDPPTGEGTKPDLVKTPDIRRKRREEN